MGLMMGFMLLVMFLMPKLMENMGKVLLFITFYVEPLILRLWFYLDLPGLARLRQNIGSLVFHENPQDY